MNDKMSLDDILAIQRTLKEHEAANMRIVRIKLSNLPVFVIASHLQNLFGSFNVETATINFNEKGESLGSGDIFLPKSEAFRAMEDFKGFALLGKELRMVLVDETTQKKRTSRKDLPRRKSLPPNLKNIIRNKAVCHRVKHQKRGGFHFKHAEKAIEEMDELVAYMARSSV